jgi:acetate CoA/acetoacetate CoA-transferase beta subunit
MGVIEVTDRGLVLKEINPEYTIEEVRNATDATLIIPDDLKEMGKE